ncbi:hypothetical protein [Dactylosporangium darangshiense]|uniref:Uncharacterized protein n=1 Tax=Dactylosporangium darangshiense TaxID=579108 RepID=A0ABP8DMQ0_9ACTN
MGEPTEPTDLTVHLRTRHPNTTGRMENGVRVRPRDYHWHRVDPGGGEDDECAFPPGYFEPIPGVGGTYAAFDEYVEGLTGQERRPVPLVLTSDHGGTLTLFAPSVSSARHRFEHGAPVELSLLVRGAPGHVAGLAGHLLRDPDGIVGVLDAAVVFREDDYEFRVDWRPVVAAIERGGGAEATPGPRGEGIVVVVPPTAVAQPAPARRHGLIRLASRCARALWPFGRS